ncbi:MAG TPA: hypothetical protein VK125_02510 [Bacillota bacterium]|nr:hypothetical protein [Bacillota bacterium]
MKLRANLFILMATICLSLVGCGNGDEEASEQQAEAPPEHESDEEIESILDAHPETIDIQKEESSDIGTFHVITERTDEEEMISFSSSNIIYTIDKAQLAFLEPDESVADLFETEKYNPIVFADVVVENKTDETITLEYPYALDIRTGGFTGDVITELSDEIGGEFSPGEEKEGRIYYEGTPMLDDLEESFEFVKSGFTFGSEPLLDADGNEIEDDLGVVYEITLY